MRSFSEIETTRDQANIAKSVLCERAGVHIATYNRNLQRVVAGEGGALTTTLLALDRALTVLLTERAEPAA